MNTQRLEFGDFVLDRAQNTLLRSGEPVSLTPKTFSLLEVLVENANRIVGKDELLEAVWHGSFVEEGNLSFTVSLLRKALNDNSQDPRFIETVPKRGYRFIAEVKEVPDAPKLASDSSEATEGVSAWGLKRSRWVPLLAAVLIICGIIIGALWGRGTGSNNTLPLLSEPFSSEKLSTTGRVFAAAISPDGKTIVYSDRNSGKESVWIRHLESGNNIEIIPPSYNIYYEFVFSPDASSLYFTRRPKGQENHGSIFRIPIFGGIPTKIAGETQGLISVSSDAARISFVRCYYRDDEYCSLWIADAEGKNERKLLSRPVPYRIADNEISPDGKTIAFAVGQSRNAGNEFSLSEVEIETGKERELSATKFFNIKHLTWLPDQSGLLATASGIPNKHFRIWHIAAGTGEAQPLTRDSETYSVLSLDREARGLVSTQVKEDFRLRTFPIDDAADSRIFTEASRVAFASDGNILFSSTMSGNSEIWSVNADGTERRQLTNDLADDMAPIVSPDNRSIFFVSNRTGEAHCWQMNSDGSGQTQITHKEGGFPLSVSQDGVWLYYYHAVKSTLWRVSLESGEEQEVFDKARHYFEISPDGSRLLFHKREGEKRTIVIASFPDGNELRTFRPANATAILLELKWMPDGKGFAYINADNEWEQNVLWIQPLDSEMPKKLADLGDEEISDLAFSPDGKNVAITQGGWKHDAVLLRGLH